MAAGLRIPYICSDMSEISNKYIGKLLSYTADLMELSGGNAFKARAYQRAGWMIERLPEPLADIAARGELGQVEGVGESLRQTLQEILDTGSFGFLDKLTEAVPAGVQEMLRLKGIGPKKISHIWKEMGIESLGELYYACIENRLAQEKGFGLKTQDKIREAIEFRQNNLGKYLYARLAPLGDSLIQELSDLLGPEVQISLTGDIRRKAEILTQVDILVDSSAREKVESWAAASGRFETEDMDGPGLGLTETESQAHVHIHFAEGDFGAALYQTTGTADHITAVNADMDRSYLNEQAIYAAAGLPFIEPELREGGGEIALAQINKLPDLINAKDIRGVVHTHSTWSDGAHSIRQMAEASMKMGYEYLVISDHSQSAFYANGLKPDRILQQHKEIDELNSALSPFRIFKSIESDIRSDGSLDYDGDVLASFDLVIASIHSQLAMDEDKATERLIRAIENPYTRILGHMTGRLLLAREGYPVDHTRIIDACAANGVVIELNANPNRLDIDWRWIRRALNKGVMISINPDAHSTEGIKDIAFGLAVARKGMLTADMCLNAKTLSAFEEWVSGNRN
jgi:DNA polymerase (family 10)